MKLSRIGVLVISAMCLTPCAHAEQHGAAYAAIEAAIDYCGRVDRPHREDYVTSGAKALASVAGVGDTGDYQAVDDSVSNALKQKSEKVGRTECAAAIGLRPAGSDGHR
jgi:hypothetical protein